MSGPGNAWAVVAAQELRDLWLSGRALAMLFAYTVLLGVTTYLVASNQELNFLEQREAVNLTLKAAVVGGCLLVVLVAADSISGERERGTLETLLLTPVSRVALAVGKGVAAVSLWLAAYVLAAPYLWWLGRDVGGLGPALAGELVVGTLFACFVAGLGLLVTTFSQSNRLSLALSISVLLLLLAPHQMPAEASRGWAGELLQRSDPFTAGLLYLERLAVNAHTLGQDLGLLAWPAVLALALPAVACVLAGRMTLLPRAAS